MMRNVALIITLFMFQQVCGQQDPDALVRAKALMEVNNFDSAIHYLEAVAAEDPGNTEVIFSRGKCYFALKRYDEARADFIFVNKKRNVMASLMLAKTEARLNRPELAVKYLREHLGSYYKLPEKDILLDKDLALIESSDAWISLWREREWYSPYDQELQEIIYLKERGDYPEAINRLRDLEKKGFRRTIVNQHLAELYHRSGNNRAALDALNKAIGADSRNTEALKLRIDLLVEEGDFEDAARDCSRLLRQAPDAFDYYLVAGRIHSNLGAYDAAVSLVNSYLELYPRSHAALNVLGEIHFTAGKYLDALSSFNKALELDKGTAAYYFNRGRTYAATRTHRYAEKDFSMALDLDPVNPEIWFAKGLTDLELGNMNTACFDFRNALRYGKYEAREYLDRHCGK
ncbi:MAG: tetratricopeptide repeat protein [Bacteroidales bacterium]|nr:tetratricopeptide repeat protein [Bacteroidales bacterium]MDT8430046.1 tetratricopeptide repeat protein [Bacteroidales bacterium]